jgi:hypothetical protein
MESFSTKTQDEIKKPTLITSIQYSTGGTCNSNQIRKSYRWHPNWKEIGQVISIYRWHSPIYIYKGHTHAHIHTYIYTNMLDFRRMNPIYLQDTTATHKNQYSTFMYK